MKTVTIKSETGLHARPASQIVQKCSEFKSEIYLIKDNIRADARSIMNIMAMAIMHNEVIDIEAIGVDSVEAENAIATILESEE